jgi:hypothetical protein
VGTGSNLITRLYWLQESSHLFVYLFTFNTRTDIRPLIDWLAGWVVTRSENSILETRNREICRPTVCSITHIDLRTSDRHRTITVSCTVWYLEVSAVSYNTCRFPLYSTKPAGFCCISWTPTGFCCNLWHLQVSATDRLGHVTVFFRTSHVGTCLRRTASVMYL